MTNQFLEWKLINNFVFAGCSPPIIERDTSDIYPGTWNHMMIYRFSSEMN